MTLTPSAARPVRRRQDRRRLDRRRGRRDQQPAPPTTGDAGARRPGGDQRRDSARQSFGRADDDPLHRPEPGRQPGLGGHELLERLPLALGRRHFLRDRASWFGKVAARPTPSPLQPGESYTVDVDGDPARARRQPVRLHPPRRPRRQPPRGSASCETDWWPAEPATTRAGSTSSAAGRTRTPATTSTAPRSTSPIASPTSRHQPAGPGTATSGKTVDVTYTVTNRARATRARRLDDRIFLSRDASLDRNDMFLGESPRRPCRRRVVHGDRPASACPTASTGLLPPRLTDSPRLTGTSASRATSASTLSGVVFEEPNALAPCDLASRAGAAWRAATVPEYQDEGNNTSQALCPSPWPCRRTSGSRRSRARRASAGPEFDVTYTVTNRGGATPPTSRTGTTWSTCRATSSSTCGPTATWTLAARGRTGGRAELHGHDAASCPGRRPDGPYYVFVVTDPPRTTSFGSVFEGTSETTTTAPSTCPWSSSCRRRPTWSSRHHRARPTAPAGRPDRRSRWTVTNISSRTGGGTWTDTAYLSADAPGTSATCRSAGSLHRRHAAAPAARTR